MVPRVRFAPSPTGYLHVGGARTALFNWLFARRYGGMFVLRIEDTDVERSSDDMVQGILDGLGWLGLDWDEGPNKPDGGGPHAPYFQSLRLERYLAAADALVAEGHAYYCYCTVEELKARRAERAGGAGEAGEAGGGWMYDRACLRMTPDDIAVREAEKQPRAIRFKVPDRTVRFTDLVHGPIEVSGVHIEDFVVLRSDGHPTYHLSVVVDDVEMGMTHVVRGDDHISNTPKHVLLYQAMGADVPLFAHVPLILGPDKKRLSKRHGATSVMEYARQGYLPEAMMNFLALLGWSPGSGNQELFAEEELISAFTLEGISGGNAVFNAEKLDWFNQQYIVRLPADELARRVRPFFEASGLWDDAFDTDRRGWFFSVLELLRPRAKRLDDFVEQSRFLLSDQITYDDAAISKHLRGNGEHLAALKSAFATLDTCDAGALETTLRSVADARGVKAGVLIHATRAAVTGKTVSPGLFDVLSLLGRDRVQARMSYAIGLATV